MNERIKKLRKVLDLTQQEFADRIGSKRNTIAKYETNTNIPSAAVISLICREFNVNEEWLRVGIGEMFKTVPSNALDALIEEYALPCEVRILIEKFLDLKPEAQQTVIDYVRQVSAALNTKDIPAVSPPNFSVDIEAEVAAYRRELELQEKAKVESAALRNIKEA